VIFQGFYFSLVDARPAGGRAAVGQGEIEAVSGVSGTSSVKSSVELHISMQKCDKNGEQTVAFIG